MPYIMFKKQLEDIFDNEIAHRKISDYKIIDTTIDENNVVHIKTLIKPYNAIQYLEHTHRFVPNICNKKITYRRCK